jgi:glycosyltransferase involved in cell wall biosynthesis
MSADNALLVSILINNHNYGQFVGEAISSALQQTYQNIEVIVVDDGSTDDSCETIAGFGRQIVPVFKEQGGQASAFNVGFAKSCGEIICFLDSDDVFLPEKVATLVEIYRDNNREWCFHAMRCVRCPDGSQLRTYQGEWYVIPAENELSRDCDLRGAVQRGKIWLSAPPTSGLTFRRSLLARILPMPESAGVSLSDLYLKVAAYGLGAGYYLSEAAAVQRIHSSNRYTSRLEQERIRLKANIELLTAYWLKRNYPSLARISDTMFAKSIPLQLLAGGVTENNKPLIRNFFFSLAAQRKVDVACRALYHGWRYWRQLRREAKAAKRCKSRTPVRADV